MKIVLQVFRVLLIYTAAAFAVCFCVSFLIIDRNILLIDGKSQYVFSTAFLLFFKYLPAVLLSGAAVGFSWSFGRAAQGRLSRFSAQIFSFLKSVYIIGLICTLVLFAAAEIGIPLAEQSLRNITDKTKNYNEYYQLANKYYKDENYTAADFYVKTALGFYSGSSEASKLEAQIERKMAESDYTSSDSRQISVANSTSGNRSLLSVRDLVSLSAKSFENEDFLNAHYYAGLALNSMKQNDANFSQARKLSSDSWNKLEQITSQQLTEQEGAYAQKKRGYAALERGDILSAFYTFSDLHSRFPSDQDTLRYLETAKDLVESQYFYIDESADLKQFEQYKNVYFCVNRPDGSRNVVYIAGITSIKKAGSMIQYLRGLSVSTYDEKGVIIGKFDAPYAKMTAVPLSNFGYLEDYVKKESKKTVFVPYILLTAIDRKTEGIVVRPSYFSAVSSGDGIGSISSALSAVDNGPQQFLIPINYDDFLTVCDATNGAEIMPLLSLVKFAPKASESGFSNEVYLQAIIYRTTYPLILMISFIFCAMVGWNYRMENLQVFKFTWIFIMPVFTAVVHFLLDTLRFLEKLVYFPLLSSLGTAALPAAAGVLIAVLVGQSFLFCAVRGE